MSTAYCACELAQKLGGELRGNPEASVTGVASLAEAGSTDLAFLGNNLYRDAVLPSAAAIVLVPADFTPEPPAGRAWIVCANTSAAFSEVVDLFAPPPVVFAPGIHPRAVVAADAQVDDSAHIGAGAVIAGGAGIGANSVIGANCVIGEHTQIGSDCLIYANVTIRERCRIGNRVIIHSGTVIGSDGFGFIPGRDGHRKIPQVGIVQIDDDVELGALVAVDRARFGKTWIKRGSKIDNQVQIAHNVIIGANCLIAGQCGFAGSCEIGDNVMFGGQVAVVGHLHIGDGAIIMGKSGITKDVPPGSTMFGIPAVERKQFARNQLSLHRIDKLVSQVRELQARLDALQAATNTAP